MPPASLAAEARDRDAADRWPDHTEDGAARSETGYRSWDCSLLIQGVVRSAATKCSLLQMTAEQNHIRVGDKNDERFECAAQERPDGIRQRLKHAVNSAPLSEQQRHHVLTEHCLVFKLNSDIVKGFRIQWRSILAQHRRAMVASVFLFLVLAYVIIGRRNT